tara:strand:- start:668 stop:997 length:330 start_codon:yes stop_codon:yes gene_type:complete
MNTIRYKHDCDNCVFLGRWKEFDLYYCPAAESNRDNFIARYGTEGSYLSGYNIAMEQYESALNGGRLEPLGMAVTVTKDTPVLKRMFNESKKLHGTITIGRNERIAQEE